MVGINLLSDFLSPKVKRGDRAAMGDVVAHIERVCELAGSRRHVALGSDADGGFVGASPELLVRRRGPLVESRPMAGTVALYELAREGRSVVVVEAHQPGQDVEVEVTIGEAVVNLIMTESPGCGAPETSTLLPAQVVAETSARYQEAYRLITGEELPPPAE